MRIGIEAKWLHQGPPSGQRVVRNLIDALVEIGGDHELHLLLDGRTRHLPPPRGIDPERCHYVWSRNNQIANVLLVPRVADRARLDAVVYQNFAPPRVSANHARVAFVHDVIFATRPELFTRRERLYFSSLRPLTASADRVCTVSESERERLVKHRYAAAESVDVVPNAPDEAFVPRERLDDHAVSAVRNAFALPERYVLYAGRLNARKNVSTLVAAMALVRDEVPLVIAGAPDGASVDLAAVARTNGVADRVRFLGRVTDAELRVLYACATVFCFPSLDEGFGLCPLEAMAAGAPVVVSRVRAMQDTCGSAAVYVDPTQPTAIASAIDALLRDPRQRAELRASGLERARAFTWRKSAERLLSCVDAAVRARTIA